MIYEEYTTEHTRSGVDICRDMPLNPGWIENDWKYAATSLAGANSYVSVPSQVSKAYLVKSPHNTGWVRMVQKLVVVQEDSTRRNNVYLLSIIPEGEYVRAYPEVIAEACKGGDMPDDFSGLIVYTRLEGGMVVYAGWYQEGWLKNSVFIFNKHYLFEENIKQLNEMLKGYHMEEVKDATRSGWMGGDMGGSTGGNTGGNTGGSTGGSTGGGNNWMYHTEGAPFWQDGYQCWNATDSSGKKYIVADTNYDGIPDTILGGSSSVGGGSSSSGWGGGSIGGGSFLGGSTGGGSTGGGMINPGNEEKCTHRKCNKCGKCLSPKGSQCTPCRCFTVKLKSSRNQIDIFQPYDITVDIIPEVSGISLPINQCVIEMSKGAGVWTPVYSTTKMSDIRYTRTSRNPWVWKIRAQVSLNNSNHTISNIIEVNERYPDYNHLLADSDIRREFDAIWQLTKNSANADGRREYGCWVYLNTATGKYFRRDLDSGVVVPYVIGTHGSVKPGRVNIMLSDNPTACIIDAVAYFHTHTPLTYAKTFMERENVGPSMADENYVNNGKCIGLVYDYKPIPPSTGITTGHNINAPAKIIQFGYQRKTPF